MHEFTYDSCIPTISTDLIPPAANKYSIASYHIFVLKWRPLNRAVWQIQLSYSYMTLRQLYSGNRGVKLHPSSWYSTL